MKNVDLGDFDEPVMNNDGRVPDFKIECAINENFKLEPDLDYKVEDMTEEQKEVFDALQFEGDDDAYEDLEDDFVFIANEGECPLKKKLDENINERKMIKTGEVISASIVNAYDEDIKKQKETRI